MPKLYTVKALAVLFDKKEDTIREWINDGDVFPNAFKIKDGWYVPAGDIKKMIKRNREESDQVESRPTSSTRQSSGFVNRWK
jgi:hypothetical protein